MGRFVLGIVVAVAALFAYDRYLRGDARAAVSEGSAFGAAELAELDLSELAAEQPDAAPTPRPEPAAPAAEPAVDSLPVTFEALRTATGPARNRVASALISRAREARSAVDTIGLLGDDNAFLATEEGRKIAMIALRRATDLPPEEAVLATSRLLAVTLHGALDAAGTAFVEDLVARHEPLVRLTACNPANGTRAKVYRVERGDTLDGIARRYREQHDLVVEAGTLQLVNGIRDPRTLRPDQVLRVPTEPLRAVVEKRSFRMLLYLGDVVVRVYLVAHGRLETPTPVATFVVGTKLEDPAWHHDGRVIPYGHPDNRLGTHFVELLRDGYVGFGVHGTWEPESLGTLASLGCVRLHNDDIAEFVMAVPRGMEVEIRP